MAVVTQMLKQAERDLGARFRGRLRADARGRLRTFCLNLRINEARRR